MRDILRISLGYLLLFIGIAAFGVLAIAGVAVVTTLVILGMIFIPLYEGTDWIKWRFQAGPSIMRSLHQ